VRRATEECDPGCTEPADDQLAFRCVGNGARVGAVGSPALGGPPSSRGQGDITVGDNGDVWAWRNLGGGFGADPVYDGASSKVIAKGGFRP
jgi:hypothetical protein